MRGIEDTAFTGVVSISTTLGRYFAKGDLSLTSIAGSGRRMVFSVEGGPTEVKCLVFMGSSFRRRRKDVCGGLQLRLFRLVLHDGGTTQFIPVNLLG
jgi:hypothetical protein